jgi:hypothetical protein
VATEVMLTTKDNPYNPFTHFNDWFMFDELKGYHTCGYIDRIAQTSEDLPDSVNKLIIDTAIEEIIALEPEIYKKVEK